MARDIYGCIGERLKLPSKEETPFKYFGQLKDFTGVDVTQTSTSIKLSCPKYISHVLKTHKWDTPAKNNSKWYSTPLPADAINAMYSHTGPDKGATKHAALANKHGFSYCTLLSELMYAYVTCRPDIGCTVITLSKFSTCLHDAHYSLLKKVAKCPHATIDWAFIHKKSTTHSDLAPTSHNWIPPDNNLPPFPATNSPFGLICLVDAAHANDLQHHRSTNGCVTQMAVRVISCQCKTQSVTAPAPPRPNSLQLSPRPSVCDTFDLSLVNLGSHNLSPPPFTKIIWQPSML